MEQPSTRTVMISTVDPLESAPAPEPTLDDRVTQLQQTISPSRLSLFLQCRLKFFFRHVAKIQKPKTAALHVGSAVHAALRAWNMARWKQQPLSLKQLHDAYSEAWSDADDPVQWQPGEEEAEKKTGWRLLETYMRESKIPNDLKPDAVEVPVEADLSQHGLPKLIGILDLVQQKVVIDFKTSSTTPNAERVAHTNEVQISSYAVLYRHNTGRRENGLELHHLVKTKNPKLVITALPPMTDRQHSRLFTLMDAYVHGLEHRDFIPSPSLQCASCEFFNECKAWH
jgi:putative RecB family exonuclease